MNVNIFVEGFGPNTDIICFDLSNIKFTKGSGIIYCDINGVESPENIEALNTLLGEEMMSFYNNNGTLSVDIKLFKPSIEYLRDLYFFENIEEVFNNENYLSRY